MVKAQLAEHGITPIDWGGEHEFVPVSAHTGEGIDDLLETLLLTAELLELKADPQEEQSHCFREFTRKRVWSSCRYHHTKWNSKGWRPICCWNNLWKSENHDFR